MNIKAVILASCAVSSPLIAAEPVQHEIQQLKQETQALRAELQSLQKELAQKAKPEKVQKRDSLDKKTSKPEKMAKPNTSTNPKSNLRFHPSYIYANTPEKTTAKDNWLYPTALVSDNRVLTYIAGTPVVTSPYTGSRPAFDGSDHIVNISSINRDIRLMEQRQTLYQTYQAMGYVPRNIPIIALSGKVEPVALYGWPYVGHTFGDLDLGSSELDAAAILNPNVEAFISIAFDNAPPQFNGQRVNNSSFDLNLGFVNIGNLDKTPFYLTAGQLYAPFGRYSSAMITSPITLRLARTKTRPFIFGYDSPDDNGPYLAGYAFISDTTIGRDGVLGINGGYTISRDALSGDFGVGFIGSMADAGGMQRTGSIPGTTFGGFASFTNGSEAVSKKPAANVHGNLSYKRYSFTAEWVGATEAFDPQDLSFNGLGAKPQAAQLEAGVTFKTFRKPASLALGYQWSKDALALNLPKQRITTVFNISIWQGTVESLEYRHDIDYGSTTYANGASPVGHPNENTLGTGKASDTITAQIGIYF